MSSMVQPDYGTRTYSPLTTARGPRQTGTQGGSFLDLAVRARETAVRVPEAAGASGTDAYMAHLKKKYGRVSVASVGKDQASLDRAGGRMSGRDVVIAPNILEEMAGDVKKALYYEQKIDYFFNTVIPQGNAICAARGLVFEPCGVVVHEDGTVTYICGCSDSPERVAEVNRINREKARKKTERQRQYQELALAAANQRRALWERAAQTEVLEKSVSSMGSLLKMRMASTPTAPPEASFPAGANMFFLDM